VMLGAVLILNLLFITAFFKELTVTSFDPAFAAAVGISVTIVHYLLMSSVAITSVGAFESVGSILVVAMFIVPGAVARLWSDRMGVTIVGALCVATLSTLLGYQLAVYFNTSVAGMMATVAGGIFLLSAFLAPRYGLLGRLMQFVSLRIRILSEDMLGLAYRCRESNYRQAFPLSSRNLVSAVGGGILPRLALGALVYGGDLSKRSDGVYELTQRGSERAQLLVRTHRLWENYLVRFLNLKSDHVHDTATKLEHFTSSEMERMLTERLESPQYDPHGKAIPPVTKGPNVSE